MVTGITTETLIFATVAALIFTTLIKSVCALREIQDYFRCKQCKKINNKIGKRCEICGIKFKQFTPYITSIASSEFLWVRAIGTDGKMQYSLSKKCLLKNIIIKIVCLVIIMLKISIDILGYK